MVRGNIRFQTVEMSPLDLDGTLLDAMKRAGFSGIGITAESAADGVLDGLGKGFGTEDIYRAA